MRDELSCPNCSSPAQADDKFCHHCGFPIKGDEDAAATFHSDKNVLEERLQTAEKRIRQASNTMYFLSGLFLLAGFGFYYLYEEIEKPEIVLILFLVLTALYGGLAYWCREQPIPAIISGLVLYTVTLIINLVADASSFYKSILVSIIVIAFLIKGLKAAIEAQSLKEELYLD